MPRNRREAVFTTTSRPSARWLPAAAGATGPAQNQEDDRALLGAATAMGARASTGGALLDERSANAERATTAATTAIVASRENRETRGI